MKRLLLCLCMCASAGAQTAVDPPVFLETVARPEPCFVHQVLHLRVRFGVERAFLTGNLLQPFRQDVDVPLRLDAPWLDDLPGAMVLPAAADDAAPTRTYVLGDGLAHALALPDRVESGRRFLVLEIVRRYLPQQAGDLTIPPPRLRFAYASRFRDDLVQGRVPEDRREGAVAGTALTIRVEPLPTTGRPPCFTGAVGRFTVRAATDRREVTVGESLKLVLRIEGEGNLAQFEPPHLDTLSDFHVRGRIEDVDASRRTVTYDLAPLRDSVREVPAIPFAFFDPEAPARYRTLETAAIPLVVRPSPGAPFPPSSANGTQRVVPGDNDIFDLAPVTRGGGDARGGVPPWLLVAGLLAPWMIALGLFCWLRARARRSEGSRPPVGEQAAAVFRTRLAAADCDVAGALTEFLAARLDCATAAVISPGLPARLGAAGVAPDIAARATKLLDDLVAVRYGGAPPAGSRECARTLVEELEAGFAARKPAP